MTKDIEEALLHIFWNQFSKIELSYLSCRTIEKGEKKKEKEENGGQGDGVAIIHSILF